MVVAVIVTLAVLVLALGSLSFFFYKKGQHAHAAERPRAALRGNADATTHNGVFDGEPLPALPPAGVDAANEEQYDTVNDALALSFAARGGIATTLYADGSLSLA